MTKFNSKKENIKLFICDFDGIFTDGKLTVYSDGKTSKKVDYKDIMAVANLVKAKIKFAIISGENSVAIDILKEKFPMIDAFQNERNKIQILKQLIEKYDLSEENVLYMGDDINDIECLKFVAFPTTVQNAHKKVKEVGGIYITQNEGGNGAVREVVDMIL